MRRWPICRTPHYLRSRHSQSARHFKAATPTSHLEENHTRLNEKPSGYPEKPLERNGELTRPPDATSRAHRDLLDAWNQVDKATRMEASRPAIETAQETLGIRKTTKPHLKDAILVCVDCEAFEFAQNKITEIGVAILDTRDLAGLSSEDRTPWLEKIKYAHFRPVQYATYVNRKFVRGCENDFNFGPSTWINLRDANKVLTRIFGDPTRLNEAADFEQNIVNQERNIVFVAHDSSGDDRYLQKVGFSLKDGHNITHIVDTSTVGGGSKKSQISLATIAVAMGLDPENLHNAGNDAGYTLQSLVAMALMEQQKPNSVAAAISACREKGKPVVNHVKKDTNQILGGTAYFIPPPMPEKRPGGGQGSTRGPGRGGRGGGRSDRGRGDRGRGRGAGTLPDRQGQQNYDSQGSRGGYGAWQGPT